MMARLSHTELRWLVWLLLLRCWCVCVLCTQVRCQSDGIAAAAVLQQLLSTGAPAAARALYAGFLSAALSSILVGSVHYASFCISKRMALQASGSNGSSSDANLMAATVGALATALVESPVELFRHQAQAGTVNGNFLSEMVSSVQKHVSECSQHCRDGATGTQVLK
jgi:hypothetical protein